MIISENILEDVENLDILEGVMRVANVMHHGEGETYRQLLGLSVLEYLRRQSILTGKNQEEIAEIRGTVRTFLEKLYVADEDRLLCELVELDENMEALVEMEKRRVKEIARAYQLDLLSEVLRLRLKLMAISALSKSDSLTGLCDRGAGAQRVRELLKKDPDKRVVTIMVDLDHFKSVNDTYGHPAGDEVLKTRARQISLSVRPEDIVVRYGGEEFLVILDLDDIEKGLEIANRLRAKFEGEPVLVDGQSISVTSSFGVALGDLKDVLNGTDLNGDLVKLADRQLYRAKGKLSKVEDPEGRNRVCVAGREPMRA